MKRETKWTLLREFKTENGRIVVLKSALDEIQIRQEMKTKNGKRRVKTIRCNGGYLYSVLQEKFEMPF